MPPPEKPVTKTRSSSMSARSPAQSIASTTSWTARSDPPASSRSNVPRKSGKTAAQPSCSASCANGMLWCCWYAVLQECRTTSRGAGSSSPGGSHSAGCWWSSTLEAIDTSSIVGTSCCQRSNPSSAKSATSIAVATPSSRSRSAASAGSGPSSSSAGGPGSASPSTASGSAGGSCGSQPEAASTRARTPANAAAGRRIGWVVDGSRRTTAPRRSLRRCTADARAGGRDHGAVSGRRCAPTSRSNGHGCARLRRRGGRRGRPTPSGHARPVGFRRITHNPGSHAALSTCATVANPKRS
jgi:hypothetical protein